MNIGGAARASGVNPKMIRYYESIGLVRAAARRGNAYRDYGERDIHELRFIGRARALGFSMQEIATLISLWRDKERPSREVHKIAADHLAQLDLRIAEMKSMADSLRKLVCACHDDDRPDCPILEDLGAPMGEH
jgi:Cu(I)-responsive transcriptional regulator